MFLLVGYIWSRDWIKILLCDVFTDLSQGSGSFCHPSAGLLVLLLGLEERRR